MARHSRNAIAAMVGKARDAIFKKANSTPLSIRQKASLEENSAGGPWCVSHTSFPAPLEEEHDAAVVLMEAIESLDQGANTCSTPSMEDVKGEWLAYRGDGGPLQTASEQAKYEWISDQTRSQPTIFYIQGGAFVSASQTP